jgi:hypothetical protein
MSQIGDGLLSDEEAYAKWLESSTPARIYCAPYNAAFRSILSSQLPTLSPVLTLSTMCHTLVKSVCHTLVKSGHGSSSFRKQMISSNIAPMNRQQRHIMVSTYKWPFDLHKLLRNAQNARRHGLLNAVICNVSRGAYWIAFANGQTIRVAPTNEVLNSEQMNIPLGDAEDSVVQTNEEGKYRQIITRKDSVVAALWKCLRNNYEADVAAFHARLNRDHPIVLLLPVAADEEA